MNIQSLHIGMHVRHPQYGAGQVKGISEHTAEIQFEGGTRTVEPQASGLEPAEAHAAVSGLDVPLAQFVRDTVSATVAELGLEKPDSEVLGIGPRWLKGKIVMHPNNPTLQTKEVPLEAFFHKIVMVRNNLRVLEQKINAHPGLSEADKIEMQQYITRSYGSLTTFNLLFRSKEDQFNAKE